MEIDLGPPLELPRFLIALLLSRAALLLTSEFAMLAAERESLAALVLGRDSFALLKLLLLFDALVVERAQLAFCLQRFVASQTSVRRPPERSIAVRSKDPSFLVKLKSAIKSLREFRLDLGCTLNL